MVEVIFPRKDGAHVVRFFPGHVPEIAHAADAGAGHITADRGGVGDLAEEKGLVPVERFEENAGFDAHRMGAEFLQEIDEQRPRLVVRQFGLFVEGRDDDESGGTDRAGGGEDLFHGVHGLTADRLVLGDNDPLEPGADGAHLDRAALEGVLELGDPLREIGAPDLEADIAVLFNEVELLGE